MAVFDKGSAISKRMARPREAGNNSLTRRFGIAPPLQIRGWRPRYRPSSPLIAPPALAWAAS